MPAARKIRFVLVLCLFAQIGWLATPCRAELQKYVTRPEPDFRWALKDKIVSKQPGGQIYDLHFVSQTWQERQWEHQLQVYSPQGVSGKTPMFLWVTGGSARAEHVALGMELARRIGAPVAFLYHIPNQPLLEGNLREDDLIAETFVRYLKTQDADWPLLLPMVKSVIKAMDVLQEFGKKEWGESIDNFIVSGASKRGWTTWLTAAVDRRVSAIAPAVIDTLNLRPQMRRQLKAFGAYSSRLEPYSSRGLLPIPETSEADRLLSIVDPWAYRDRLTIPKLIVNGTNDFYWATDALNLYWDGIPGDKWVLYVPNAGHNLRRRDRPPREQLDDLIDGLAAFSRHQITGTAMPKLSWIHERVDGKLRLTIAGAPQPAGARLWIAETATMDFRGAKWRSQELSVSDGKIVGEVALPEKEPVAFFGEVDFEIDGLKYRLSTQMQMTN
ncbi:MAG TPA: PhoPQ-activated protein PqaA family protein [Candidatus Limnocylindria bacterium]|nr:PhoPQ-activated protein PqaA family protein [Candidatus Limnocylindria bacterium]